jgi:hypothetical protein
MSHSANNGSLAELSLVKVYMDLTGAPESRARSVFMHICCEENGVLPGKVNGMSPMGFAASNRLKMPVGKPASKAVSGWTELRAPAVPAASGA